MWLTSIALAACVAAPVVARYMQALIPTLVGVLVLLVMLRLVLPSRLRR
jgi:hypothetical protein